MGYPRKKHQQQQFDQQRVMKRQQVVHSTPLFDIESNCHDLRRTTVSEFSLSLVRAMQNVLSDVKQRSQRVTTSTNEQAD